jgi:hypothetical protein
VREADITAICEPILYAMWDRQHLKTLRATTASYRDSFAFLYADDVRTSQETYLFAFTACCGDSFTLSCN